MRNKDTDKKGFENVHKILLDGIYDTLNILIKAGIFGDFSTDKKASNWYYIVKFSSGPYTIQDGTTIDGKIISYGDRLVN